MPIPVNTSDRMAPASPGTNSQQGNGGAHMELASALREAAGAGDLAGVTSLLNKGAGINTPDPTCNKCTPLHAAVLGGHPHVVRGPSHNASPQPIT
eukprot:4877631-Pyramimonas_sp.AAC.1